ncbi:MAG: hypothetical protein V5A45_14865, partial [Haloarculaceae archaeon]
MIQNEIDTMRLAAVFLALVVGIGILVSGAGAAYAQTCQEQSQDASGNQASFQNQTGSNNDQTQDANFVGILEQNQDSNDGCQD